MDNTKRVKKYDYLRVLVTETLPYETPIIFLQMMDCIIALAKKMLLQMNIKN